MFRADRQAIDDADRQRAILDDEAAGAGQITNLNIGPLHGRQCLKTRFDRHQESK